MMSIDAQPVATAGLKRGKRKSHVDRVDVQAMPSLHWIGLVVCDRERALGGSVETRPPWSERAGVAHLDADLAHAEPVVDARHPERGPIPSGAELQISGRVPDFQPDPVR